jgi:hypothetical protein
MSTAGGNRPDTDVVEVDTVMRQLEDEALNELRRRIVERGGPRDYDDPQIFRSVEALLRRAVERPDLPPDPLLLPHLLGDDPPWQLDARVRMSSHRPVIGPCIVFVKRRLLLPLTRWLYEFTLDNFHRQQRLNHVLIACLEELAIENARLRRDLRRLEDKP